MFFFVSVSGPLRPYRPAQENLVLLFLLQVSKWQMASVETHTHTSWALLTNYRSVYMKKFWGGSKETDGRATGTNCADVDPFSARLQYSRRGNRNFFSSLDSLYIEFISPGADVFIFSSSSPVSNFFGRPRSLTDQQNRIIPLLRYFLLSVDASHWCRATGSRERAELGTTFALRPALSLSRSLERSGGSVGYQLPCRLEAVSFQSPTVDCVCVCCVLVGRCGRYTKIRTDNFFRFSKNQMQTGSS